MHERQEIDQYFFDEPTLRHLARFASRFDNPCCLCTPSLGEELEKRGVQARTLDVDKRFSWLQGFLPYDLSKPEPLDERFGIIICDPPFLQVSLRELLAAIRVLCRDDFTQPILINYLSSRAREITAIFAAFNLQPTGYMPGYRTIQNTARNTMQFYGNLGPQHPLKPPVPII